MKKQEPQVTLNKTNLIVLVLVFSIILYIAGVYSGLYANKVLEQQTEKELNSIKSDTEAQILGLSDSIVFIKSALQEIQLEREFISTLPEEQTCSALDISLRNMLERLQGYRNILPYRLESYEFNRNTSQAYDQLKDEYQKLSIQTWVMGRSIANMCETNVVTALYLYNSTCVDCELQGKQLDAFTQYLVEDGKSVLLFTIDANSKESVVSLIQEQYNITQVPAVLVDDSVFQGRIFLAQELVGVAS